MKLGLQIPYFTWPGGPPEMGGRLGEIVRAAEDAGYDSIWVMDHFFQLQHLGSAEWDMLEAYTTLGFIAAHTSRVTIGALVGGVTYRHPGILIKQATTLDVISGGRAWLGIGAAWYEREHKGLGVPFPPVKERFERLEETLQIAHKMWEGPPGAFEGKHYQLAETLNSPPALQKPHPPIMIGGSGERKTLRLVARYGDACNIFGDADTARHKFEVLRRHCEAERRNYDEIKRTLMYSIDVGTNGEKADQAVEALGRLAEAGAQVAIGQVVGVENIRNLELVGNRIIPQIQGL